MKLLITESQYNTIIKNINPIVYHGTTNLKKNFIPSIVNWEDEVGAHFATTIEQAEEAIKRQNLLNNTNKPGRILKFKLDIKNPLRVPDIGRWYPNKIFDEIIEPMNMSYPKTKSTKYVKDWPISNRTSKDIIKIFLNNGYDSLIYDNLYEGNGESYIALKKNQIIPLQ
jgi:hypothetical protein